MQETQQIIPVERLPVGVQLSAPIYTGDDVLLLGAGTRITSQFLESLAERGIKEVSIASDDLAPARKANKGPRDHGEKRQSNGWAQSATPLLGFLKDCREKSYSPDHQKKVSLALDATGNNVSDIKLSTRVGKSIDTQPLIEGLQDFVDAFITDSDQTMSAVRDAASSVTNSEDFREIQRMIELATLSMSVATRMEFDGKAVLQVGLTALLSDVGRQLVGLPHVAEILHMDEADRWDYCKFPELGANSIEQLPGVHSRVVEGVRHAYEQFDGYGFPSGLRGQRIHPYARIISTCRIYTALISDKRHWGFHPHHAIAYLLNQATMGHFDPKVVKGIFASTCLFPIGCRVQLADGRLATVKRRGEDVMYALTVETDEGQWVKCSKQESDPQPSAAQILKVSYDGNHRCRSLPKEWLASHTWNWFSSSQQEAIVSAYRETPSVIRGAG